MKKPAYALVDDSFGPAQALRDVWISHGQQKDVAHNLTTLLNLSTTGHTGPTRGKKIFIF